VTSSRKIPITLAVIAVLILIAFAASFAIDPYLRGRIEGQLNHDLIGYHASLRRAHLNLIGGTLSLYDLTIVQNAHPLPPVGHIPLLQIGVQWSALLRLRVVADCLLSAPHFYINLTQLRSEVSSNVPLQQRGWQDAIQDIYPFKINRFHVTDGRVVYVDADSSRPLTLDHVSVTANNIRNVFSPNDPYPSPIAVKAIVFNTGQAAIRGKANFLAKPEPSVLADFHLDHVPLTALDPAVRRINLNVTGGYLSTDGTFEYSSKIERVDVHLITCDHVNIEYVHQASTAQAEAQRAEMVKKAALHANNAPGLLLQVRQAEIADGTFLYRDQAVDSPYHIYITSLRMRASDLSNQSAEGISTFRVDGEFMGSGRTALEGNFRPQQQGPDFDINLAVENTRLESLNDLLRHYGRFDVQSGLASVYSQVTVRRGEVTGYVKPLFTNLQVYSRAKDKGKSIVHQTYELAVGGAAKLLRSHSTKAVATNVNLSGKLDNPNVSTLQAVLELVRNAFLNAIVPGFDRQENLAQQPAA
jgi:Domain of Unknown Function (DUF748)